MTTIHPGIFGRRAPWADSGPLRMNTIASRDQFKPIRIGKNLVVNYYKGCFGYFFQCFWFDCILSGVKGVKSPFAHLERYLTKIFENQPVLSVTGRRAESADGASCWLPAMDLLRSFLSNNC